MPGQQSDRKTQIKRKISPKSFGMYLIVCVLQLHEQTRVLNTFNILQNLITNSDFRFFCVVTPNAKFLLCYIITIYKPVNNIHIHLNNKFRLIPYGIVFANYVVIIFK